MKTFLKNFLRDERGLTTVEYAVAGGLIAATIVAAFSGLGAKVLAIITSISGQLP